MAVFSIVVLVAVIAIACLKKMNAGLLAIVGTFIILVVGRADTTAALSSFKGTLFVQYLMLMVLYAIPARNGAFEIITGKLLKKTGTWIIKALPLVVYAFGLICSLLGAGTAGYDISLPLCLMGAALGVHPMLMPIMNLVGANAATLHPNFMAGLVAKSVLEPLGHGDSSMALFYMATVIASIFALILYFVLKGWKVDANANLELGGKGDEKLSRTQLISVLAIVVQVILTNTTGWELGMICAAMLVIEMLCGVVTQKEALGGELCSYPTLLMICGVSILVNQVRVFGGIDLIVKTLAPVVNGFTVTPIVAVMSGCLSWVSSTMGVVMPTVIPLLDGFRDLAGGSVLYNALLVACVSSSHMAAISPMSTGGGVTMAYVSAANKNMDTGYMFKFLWKTTILAVLFNVVLSTFGIMGIIAGLF